MTIADLLGVASELEFDGKTYALKPPNLIQQAKFSRRLEKRARDAALRATDLPEADADRLLRAVVRDIGAGYWEVDSPGYVEALQTPDGMAYMLHLTLHEDHKEVTEVVARKMVDKAMKEIAAVLMREAGHDPKILSGVEAVLGLPPGWLSGSGSGSSGSATPPTGAPSQSPPSAA